MHFCTFCATTLCEFLWQRGAPARWLLVLPTHTKVMEGGRAAGGGEQPAPPDSPSVSWLAWAIVAMAFFSDALAMGGRSFFAVVLPLWETEFGWSRSHVSSAMSLVHILQGVSE